MKESIEKLKQKIITGTVETTDIDVLNDFIKYIESVDEIMQAPVALNETIDNVPGSILIENINIYINKETGSEKIEIEK